MSRFDVVGIGNAIVDVIAPATDTFLDHMGIEKGVMQLVDAPRAEALYAAMERRTQAPGGSVANTLAGLGVLGLSCGFAGRVADDALGRFYVQAMEAGGTRYLGRPVEGADLPTSRSMIFVSPDGERSMNTHLGISAELSESDVDAAAMGSAGLLFLEGYLFDREAGQRAFRAAAEAMPPGRRPLGHHPVRSVLRRAPPRGLPRARRGTDGRGDRQRARVGRRSTRPTWRPRSTPPRRAATWWSARARART